MPLDPDVKALLDTMESAGLPKIGSVSATEYRAVQEGMTAAMPPGPDVHCVKDDAIPVQGGSIPVRLYRPASPSSLIVYYHGGGWTIGTLDAYDAPLRKLANTANAAIVSVDYRLAPEHPFPAAVEDAFAALHWAGANIEELAGAKLPLTVAGDSAGGNLAAIVSQLARDNGGPSIDAQVLIYPSTEGDIDADYMDRFEAPFLTKDEIAWFFDQYVPDKGMRRHPLFAPAYAADLSGLPPAFVLTAEYDLLCEDGENYAEMLKQAGVHVLSKRYDGTIHGFFSIDGGLKHSVQATDDIANFIKSVIRT